MVIDILNPNITIKPRQSDTIGLNEKYDFLLPPPKVGVKVKAIHVRRMGQKHEIILQTYDGTCSNTLIKSNDQGI